VLTNLRLKVRREFVSTCHQHHFVTMRAVCSLMRDFNGFRFPGIHPYHSLFKIRDHFRAAYCELQGFAPNGGIEYCAIFQFAGIVDINRITLFRLRHRFPLPF
jgi:hypothetical protein